MSRWLGMCSIELNCGWHNVMRMHDVSAVAKISIRTRHGIRIRDFFYELHFARSRGQRSHILLIICLRAVLLLAKLFLRSSVEVDTGLNSIRKANFYKIEVK